MACSNCNSTQQCGCTSGSYTVVPPCPPACSEVFNASCIVYTGADITCGADTVISRNDYLDSVITKLVDYVCANTSSTKIVLVDTLTTGNPVTVTHNLGSTAVLVQVIDDATNTLLDPANFTVDIYLSNSVNVTRSDAAGLTRIVVIG